MNNKFKNMFKVQDETKRFCYEVCHGISSNTSCNSECPLKKMKESDWKRQEYPGVTNFKKLGNIKKRYDAVVFPQYDGKKSIMKIIYNSEDNLSLSTNDLYNHIKTKIHKYKNFMQSMLEIINSEQLESKKISSIKKILEFNEEEFYNFMKNLESKTCETNKPKYVGNFYNQLELIIENIKPIIESRNIKCSTIFNNSVRPKMCFPITVFNDTIIELITDICKHEPNTIKLEVLGDLVNKNGKVYCSMKINQFLSTGLNNKKIERLKEIIYNTEKEHKSTGLSSMQRQCNLLDGHIEFKTNNYNKVLEWTFIVPGVKQEEAK